MTNQMGDGKEHGFPWENAQEVFSVVLSVLLIKKNKLGVFCIFFFPPVIAYFGKNRTLNSSSCCMGRLFILRLRLKTRVIYSSVVSLQLEIHPDLMVRCRVADAIFGSTSYSFCVNQSSGNITKLLDYKMHLLEICLSLLWNRMGKTVLEWGVALETAVLNNKVWAMWMSSFQKSKQT